MCGICGLITKHYNRELCDAMIRRMILSLAHRGPDAQGIFSEISDAYIGLGHRRLSIIDLTENANQPIFNENKRFVLIFNGEIYNFIDLRKDLEAKGHRFNSSNDAEVVIHLFEDYKEKCLEYLRGMFAFAIWDKREKVLFLARDRIGKKPLVYYLNKDTFCFASEIQSLLRSNIIEKDINRKMVGFYLTYGYIPAPQSIYKKVFKLLPGHYAIYKNEQLTINRYWSLDYKNKITINEKEALNRLDDLLIKSVKLRLVSDVSLGVFLSGGLDSSMIVAIMSKFLPKVKTFSVGFKEQAYNELGFAREIAKKYNTEHHEFIIDPKIKDVIPLLVERYGEPYADSSALATYYLARESKKFIKVALNGDGGDESFAGYDRYVAMYLSEYYYKIPKIIRELCIDKISNIIPDSINFHNHFRRLKRFLKGSRNDFTLRYLEWVSMLNYNLRNKILTEDIKKDFSEEELESYIGSYLNDYSGGKLIDRLLYTDINTNLPNDLTVKMDIATMSNSLEARSPLLDHRLMEFMASLPKAIRFRGNVKKYLFKKLAVRYLPRKNIFRQKRGFGVPVGNWFRNDLKDFVCDILLSERFFNRNYCKKNEIKNMVELHINGRADFTSQLWTLIMLELWHQKFID